MFGNTPLQAQTRHGEVSTMQTPEQVSAMLELHKRGLGRRKIAKILGCSPETVRRYLRSGCWKRYGAGRGRGRQLEELQPWLEAAFRRHRGNAEVVRQELLSEHGVAASLRTVERAVEHLRREMAAEAVATVRFETPPGKQLQVDFGEMFVEIAGERTRVHLCVLTLGWSRRCFVQAYAHERQVQWLDAMEQAFAHFGGVPQQMLVDNARALVSRHDVQTGEVEFNTRFAAFAAYWGFVPRACRPFRARTKGKDESGVRYVKRNALAGRSFASWEQLHAHLQWWMRQVADVRVHGTTGERPIDRFVQTEAAALQPLPAKPPFVAERQVVRMVHNDACVEFESNWYSVPWRLIRTQVVIRQRQGRIVIVAGNEVVAEHQQASGRRQRVVAKGHWKGLVPSRPDDPAQPSQSPPAPHDSELGRPLSVYQELVQAQEVAA